MLIRTLQDEVKGSDLLQNSEATDNRVNVSVVQYLANQEDALANSKLGKLCARETCKDFL